MAEWSVQNPRILAHLQSMQQATMESTFGCDVAISVQSTGEAVRGMKIARVPPAASSRRIYQPRIDTAAPASVMRATIGRRVVIPERINHSITDERTFELLAFFPLMVVCTFSSSIYNGV